MPLGTEVLGRGNIVLDGDLVPPKRAQPPIFGPSQLWPNGRPSQLLLSTLYDTEMVKVTPLWRSLASGL